MDDSTRVTRRPRRASSLTARTAAAIIATAGLALVVCGCGGSPGSHAASAPQNGALAFSRCMRSHGVPDFPDPGASQPSHVKQQSPGFQAALQACHQVNPKQVPPPTHPSASQRQTALRFAHCMRTHGYPNFPDPAPNPPGPGNGTLLGAFNEYFALGPETGTHPHSAAFLRTATECGVNPLSPRS